jgi:hypothetical protein
MPTYRVVHINGLREKIIVARDEDQAQELWGGELRLQGAADRLGLTAEAYRHCLHSNGAANASCVVQPAIAGWFRPGVG